MILADANTTTSLTSSVPLTIAEWLACLAFFIGLVNGLLKLGDRLKDKPPASDVRAELVDKFTPKEIFNAHVQKNDREHENIFQKIGGVERGSKNAMDGNIGILRTERKDDMRDLHKQINEVDKKVASLETETKNQNAWLSRMDQKLDELKARA